ncbi:MAG: tryptophan--tRNA ligase, partial [Nitratireductor sp.]|nr:tryptophan--tRNA ligase [Nitratireductor sp.]
PLPETPDGLKERPEAENLVGIYAALSGKTRAEVVTEFAGKEFSVFKPALADLAVDHLAPINSEMRRLLDDPAHVDAVLKDGADRARAIAEETMKEVKAIVGFLG